MTSRSQIPHTINSQKLLKDFSKDIRHAERYLISLNPPKPERESKRKRKKPLNKDFVNYDVADQISGKSLKAGNVKETNKVNVKIEVEDGDLAGYRPPLKLTLPKLAMYPYVRSNVVSNDGTTPVENEKRTKMGKQSMKVIKFKLGDKEVIRSTSEAINNFGNFTTDHSIETPKELTWKQSSVYDFHDGSNESSYSGFTIDEAPKRKKHPNSKSAKSLTADKKLKRDFDGDVDVLTNAPKNGIEELLKASAYTLGTAARLEPP